MPGLNGIDATKQIHQTCPAVKVIVLSMRSDSRAVLEALAAGASAYLLKEAAFDEVVVALKVAMQGKTYLSPAIAHLVVRNSVEHWSAALDKCVAEFLGESGRSFNLLPKAGHRRRWPPLFMSA